MSNLSRRNLVASAAALPALAVPAVAGSVPNNTLSQLADWICAEYDRLGTINDRDITLSDLELYDTLTCQFWDTPATSISDFAAKARVLDKGCRLYGEVHSDNARLWDFIDELMAMERKS
jgi:hypothetical protein